MTDPTLSSSERNAAEYGRRSVFTRFSTLSAATLPRYSITDNFHVEEPPPFDDSLEQPILPAHEENRTHPAQTPSSLQYGGSQYSFINPTYSTILDTTLALSSGNAPSQSPQSNLEYIYPIRSNKPWATLHLSIRDSIPGNPHPSQSRPKTPRIWGSEPISGAILLDLDSPQTIQHISIQLKGKIVTSSFGDGSYTFVSRDYPVWSRTMGDPRRMSQAGLQDSLKGKFDGKLQGQYSFPFSFPFPSYVDLSNKAAIYPRPPEALHTETEEEPRDLQSPPAPASPTSARPDKGKKKRSSWSLFSPRSSSYESSGSREQQKRQRSGLPQELISGFGLPVSRQNEAGVSGLSTGTISASPMPQNFAEKGLYVTLTYELSAVVSHGRLRPDSKIRTNIAHLPSIQPLPMSVRRQQAYEAGALLPGPKSDPDGWFALPKATTGGFFNEIPSASGKSKIEIDCTLYLAKPLAYTRGTVIPCYISFGCTDAQALHALCTTKAPDVRLIRRFRHFTPYGGDRTAAMEEHHARGYTITAAGSTSGAQMLAPTGSAGSSGKGGDLKTILHEVAHAVWWIPPKEVAQDPTLKWLEGEIHLEPGLQPSCACPIFSFEYAVEIFPPRSPQFELDVSQIPPRKALVGDAPAMAMQPVEVTTLHRPEESVPVAFSEAPKTKFRTLSTSEMDLMEWSGPL